MKKLMELSKLLGFVDILVASQPNRPIEIVPLDVFRGGAALA